jgi:cytochrome P450
MTDVAHRQPTDCPATDIDLWHDDVLVDPYPSYAALRRLGRVVWLSRYDAYALAGYDEVRTALQDWETFSSASGVGMDPGINARSGRGILTTDPPVHDSRRRVLNAQLVPRAVMPFDGFVIERAEEIVASVVQSGTFDAVADLARPYSVELIADLVGLPAEGREQLLPRAEAAFNTFGPANELLSSSMDGLLDMHAYCTATGPDRLMPGRWGTQIYDAGQRGDVEPEACVGLMFAYTWAGMDTTVNALAAAVWLFAEHPDQWDMIRADPSLIPSAFNEVLRIETPVQRFSRSTTTATEIGGSVLPAGARVALLFGSANRDDRHYPEADRFDVTRNPIDHLSFGRGLHHCVGSNLARMEGHALLAALARRVARFELLDVSWRRNNATHGPAAVHVRAVPGA